MLTEFTHEAHMLRDLATQFEFPSNYLVLDCETSGFSFYNDFIIEAGWAVVRDNQVVHTEGLLLDWSRLPQVNHSFIRAQLERQARDYAKAGRPHYYPWERLCDEGEHPLDVLHAYATLIYDHLIDPGSVVVGHGLWRFDRKFIDNQTRKFLQGYLLPWKMNSIFDTGLLEKAAQMNEPPRFYDTLDDWLKRVNNAHAKVKWNLENHCVPKYRLVERYGVDMSLMHTAGFDCVLIHHLLDTFRQLTEILNGQKVVSEEGTITDGQNRPPEGPSGLRPGTP